MSPFLTLVLIGLLQSALIHYQHFSPFERESNLRAVLWGARPGKRYWAILALDLGVTLLTALLVLNVWPSAPGAEAGLRAARSLPVLAAAWLVGAAAQHNITAGIIRFPRFDLILARFGAAALLGITALGLVYGAASQAAAPGWDSGLALWFGSVGKVLPGLALLGLLVFLGRGLSFYLRLVPLAGNFLHGLVSSGLLVWLVAQAGEAAGRASGAAAPAGGLEPALAAVSAAALLLLGLAWRLPGMPSGVQGVEPPPLVISQPDLGAGRVEVNSQGGRLVSDKLTVEVRRKPFTLWVEDAQGERLWELAPGGLALDLLLQKTLAIPLLYTGNTIKSKWLAWRRPLTVVKSLQAEGDAFVLVVGDGRKNQAQVRLSFHRPGTLHLQVRLLKGSGLPFLPPNSVSLAFQSPPDAHYLGFGQRFDRFDQRGQELYFLVEEGGVGYQGVGFLKPLAPVLSRLFGARGSFPNGEKCTGFPVPFGLVSRETGPTTGLFWDTYQPSWLKLPDPQSAGPAHLSIFERQVELYLCSGPTALEAIQQYTELTGRSAPPPPWVLLPWKTRTGAVVKADVIEDIERFRELGIPLAQVGVEHWQEIRGSYEYSPQWYPRMDELVQRAREHGYRIHMWHFPYMNAGCATHLEGVRQGYFIRNRLGLPYQQRIFHGLATVVDYSNPQAADWHGRVVAERIYRAGFSAAMTDYAESVPPDSVFANGQSGLAMRNAYPVMYCQAMQAAAEQVLGSDYLNYPRAGYAGSQRFVTAQWPGDQDTDWDDGDGLPAAVRAMLNVSLCGFPVHGSDIGGWYDWFAPITTKELFIRWAEVGAYSPLMRAHGGPIGRNREPWKFDDETVAIYRALSEEHVRLFPYLYSLAHAAAATGVPIIRHPALLWPGCAELYAVEDAWMIGEALYVAPVLQPGQSHRTVILPPGEWWDLEASRPVTGPAHVVVDARLGQTPRFLRRGWLLPRFTRVFDTFDRPAGGDHLARTGSLQDDLEVWVYPQAGGEPRAQPFVLFDGTLLEYPAGQTGSFAAGPRHVSWKIFDHEE